MRQLRLIQRGHFAGQFIVEDNEIAYSVGDYLHVRLNGRPYQYDTFEAPNGQVPVMAFPLVIEFSAHSSDVVANVVSVMGIVGLHWFRRLNEYEMHTVTSHWHPARKGGWYMPKIDGYIPGPFGAERKIK